MNKKLIFGLIIIVLIIFFSFKVFMQNFQIFDKPNELIIKQERDSDRSRKIILSEIIGNSTTNNSFHINASNDCSEKKENLENIFTVSSAFLSKKDIKFYWKSFDTLTITFDEKFNIINQKKVTEKINPKIVIEYIKIKND